MRGFVFDVKYGDFREIEGLTPPLRGGKSGPQKAGKPKMEVSG